MVELYRLYEKFEVPKGDVSYWEALNDALENILLRWGDPVSISLCRGLAEGLEAQYATQKRAGCE